MCKMRKNESFEGRISLHLTVLEAHNRGMNSITLSRNVK